MAPRAGLEPATLSLTARCSAIELPGNGAMHEGAAQALCQRGAGHRDYRSIPLPAKRNAAAPSVRRVLTRGDSRAHRPVHGPPPPAGRTRGTGCGGA